MGETEARQVARALGGTAWDSGGNLWLVRFDPPDGRVVVISGDLVCAYANLRDFHAGQESQSIRLA